MNLIRLKSRVSHLLPAFVAPADGEPRAAGFPIPSAVRFFGFWLLLLVVLFGGMRVGLVLRNKSVGDGNWGDLLPAFWRGIRFDVATACYLSIPVFILCYLPWASPGRGPRRRRAFLWALTLVLGVLAFVMMCEFEFFNEFRSRFNQIAIRYLDQPATVGGMVWHSYPVMRYVGCWIVIAALIHLALRWIIHRSFPTAAGGSQSSPKGELLGAFFILTCIVVGSRGGVQGEPLAWGDAFRSDNEFTNQMSLNGLWTLGHAMRDSVGRGSSASRWVGHMRDDEARHLARGMILAPGERVSDSRNRTVLRTGGDGGGVLLTRPNGKPVNVVVVMMESFSARYCGAAGAPRSFTPSFDALAREGVLFDRCLSAGTHTHQGIFATLLGFPNLPGYETLMSSGVANQQFLSLPAIFKAKDYQTLFLYNGDFSWDNMRGFFRQQGVDRFVGGDDMTEAKYRDSVWGVSDGDLFDRCNAEFEAASKRGPFMAAVMTLSNHAPFEVPPVPGAAPITDQGVYNKRLEAMRYADWAIGKFIEDARKLSYFDNTLFVFVGDHGFNVPPVLTEVQMLYHHVPLLFFAPGLLQQRGIDHRVASQVNIIPSVLGLLDMDDAPQASWGPSLFGDGDPSKSFAVFKLSGGGRAVALARGEDLLVLGSARGTPVLMKFDLGWPASVRPMTPAEAEAGRDMERQLRAYVQSALSDLLAQRAGVPATPLSGGYTASASSTQ